MLIDEISKRYYNQQVTFNSPSPYALGEFELTQEVVATLTGAMDGSVIDLQLAYPDNDTSVPASKAVLSVTHGFLARPAVYEIAQSGTGYTCVTIDHVMLKPQHTNQGLGLRMFVHQAFTAELLDISAIFLRAVGDGPGGVYNGSYTWARFGFMPVIDEVELAQFRRKFPDVIDLADLMSTEAGRARWRAEPSAMSMCFDISDDCCWNTLNS
jgi:hypothetical protein